MKFKIVNKNKFIFTLLTIILILLFIIILIVINSNKKNNRTEDLKQNAIEVSTNVNDNTNNEIKEKKEITDWRLILVNIDNALPEDYNIELADIDQYRQFDARAIEELKKMVEAERKSGASGMWVQSGYRSIEMQTKVFNEQVQEYINQGKTKEEAEKLTLKIINKPGTSEHNLGLAVDFNYANYDFEETTAFKWLKENAEDYGFILRYPKDKVEITKVNYEPWHWRYVGVENAKEINKLGYCLEEYIEYLQNN